MQVGNTMFQLRPSLNIQISKFEYSKFYLTHTLIFRILVTFNKPFIMLFITTKYFTCWKGIQYVNSSLIIGWIVFEWFGDGKKRVQEREKLEEEGN